MNALEVNLIRPKEDVNKAFHAYMEKVKVPVCYSDFLAGIRYADANPINFKES